MTMCHFQYQNGPFVLKIFVSTNHCCYFHLPIGPFHCAKSFLWIQSYVDAQFLGPKWPISPNDNFFGKPVNEPCFFHSCLSTCQTCSFHRMLMNHKNFHFRQIPDKNNDAIFLKSPKTMFLGHFCTMGFFQKNSALPHTTIYGTLIPC